MRERGWGGLSNSWQGIRKRWERRCEPRRCSCLGANSTRSCNEAFKRANIDNFLEIFCLSESTSNLRSRTSTFPALRFCLSLSLPRIIWGISLINQRRSLSTAIHRFPLVVRSSASYLLSTRTRHAACPGRGESIRVFAKLRRFEVPASSSGFLLFASRCNWFHYQFQLRFYC